jgi:hypothetical protein
MVSQELFTSWRRFTMRIVTILFALFCVVIVTIGFTRREMPGPLTGPTPICPARNCPTGAR